MLDAIDRGQLVFFKATDIEVSKIKFPGFVAQFASCWIGMMIVVQFFATNKKRPRYNVGTEIIGFGIAVAPPVSQAVYDTCGP